MDFRPSRRRFGCALARMTRSASVCNGSEGAVVMLWPVRFASEARRARLSIALDAVEVHRGPRVGLVSRLIWSQDDLALSRPLGARSIGDRPWIGSCGRRARFAYVLDPGLCNVTVRVSRRGLRSGGVYRRPWFPDAL